MKIHFITICLDGMPYIKQHLPEFFKMKKDWHWWVVEGVAGPNRDTAWVAKIPPRLSNDGSTEYLIGALKGNPRMTVIQNPYWNSKTTMFNNVVSRIREQCIVMPIDSDEIWTADQLDKIVAHFEHDKELSMMQFKCNYFVGKDIVTTGDNSYGNNPGEWLRAWRYSMGNQFNTHEPPVLNGNKGRMMTRDETAKLGLVFDHYAWATEAQVKFKETYYKYPNAVAQWKLLQANTKWPCKLKAFLPWVDENATADKIKR